VVIHISSRHVDLTRVLRGWSGLEQRRVAVFGFHPTPRDVGEGAVAAIALAIAPDTRVLQKLVGGGKWQWLGSGKEVLWSDDRTDLLAALGEIRF